MLSILKGGEQENRDAVFTSYNYIDHGQQVFPMRTVITRDYAYTFNPWANGVRKRCAYHTENQSGLTMTAMDEAAKSDPELKKRVDYIYRRSRDELFDLRKDPCSFNNLAQNREYHDVLKLMKMMLAQEMLRTNDPLLDALQKITRYPEEWDVPRNK